MILCNLVPRVYHLNAHWSVISLQLMVRWDTLGTRLYPMYMNTACKSIQTILIFDSQELSNQKARKKLANQKWIHKQRDITKNFWEPLRRRTIPAVLSVCKITCPLRSQNTGKQATLLCWQVKIKPSGSQTRVYNKLPLLCTLCNQRVWRGSERVSWVKLIFVRVEFFAAEFPFVFTVAFSWFINLVINGRKWDTKI